MANTTFKTIDLHIHLDGAISIQSARELAALQGIDIPDDDATLSSMMTVSPDCKDLTEFLDKFSFPCSLIQTKKGISTAVYNLCEELMQQGVIYTEIRFAPSKSCDRGLTQEEVVLAALEGLNRSSLDAQFILSCMRGEAYEVNKETVTLVKKYLGKGVCATDLAGAEALYPTSLYADLFAYAVELGVPFTMHAGEASGPESVWQALRFGASRIGHGTRSINDPELMKYLADHKIPLCMCPTSNVQTCIAPNVASLPIKHFIDAGIVVTINTDDPSVEGTNIQKEWEKVIEAFALTPLDVKKLLINSANAAFITEEHRQQILDKLQ